MVIKKSKVEKKEKKQSFTFNIINPVLFDTKKIIPNQDNPRIIKDEKFQKLIKSIKDLPRMLELRPLILNDDNVIVWGNMRFRAIQELGISKVPIVRASDYTEEEIQEIIIKDNVGYGEWDMEMLANDFDIEDLELWGMDMPDIELEEMEDIEDKEEKDDWSKEQNVMCPECNHNFKI